MEKERHSRDMHDNLGQVLGFISLQAQGIKQELANADVDIAQHKLDKLVYAAQSANNELRKYIRNARSAETMETDFITALKQVFYFVGLYFGTLSNKVGKHTIRCDSNLISVVQDERNENLYE